MSLPKTPTPDSGLQSRAPSPLIEVTVRHFADLYEIRLAAQKRKETRTILGLDN